MERNDARQPCSKNLTNEKIPNKKEDINVIEEDDVNIDEKNEFLSSNDGNIHLMVENTLDEKNEHGWLIIEEDSDSSIDSDIDLYTSLPFKKYMTSKKNNSKATKLVNQKIKNSTLDSKINESIFHDKETNNKSDLPSSKLSKHTQHFTNSTLNDLYRPSCSTSIPGPSHSNNLPDLSCPTSIPGPSSSNKSSNLTTHKLPSLCNDDSSHTNLKLEREQEEIQQRSLENIEVSNLENCDLTKNDLSEKSQIDYSYKEPETNNTECFVEDPDIVNPDIMYNIDLKEYYNQLELLLSKIIKTPDDPTGLIEYKQLPPIPQIDQTHKFTVDERMRFEMGISEWEYQIDRDDWNKIMVKRAVVFTAHAGFSIANEESLYVLADVAIDYIKKLAVIMKKYFDIQADGPQTANIDPIDNGLKEVGVEGGVRELIKHYEDDVFGRRKKLLRKCRYTKSLIDDHFENVIKTVDDLKEESSTNEVEENVISIKKESAVKEIKTEIESGIEEVIVETQFSTDENIFTDTQVERIDPPYVDNTDIKVKMDTGPRNIEYIKINASGLKRRKINYSITPTNAIVRGFERLKTIENVPKNQWVFSSGSEMYPVPKKSEKLLDYTPKKVMKYLYSPIGVSPKVKSQVPIEDEGALGLSKMADQLDEDFNHYQDSTMESNIQTIYVHTLSDPDEAISMNDDNADYSADNTVQIIPVINENDDSDSNIDYDIVSVDSFL